jgi:flavin-dependent dehydrogenase
MKIEYRIFFLHMFFSNKMDKQLIDVVVIGDGPAGATVALKLSKLGLSVVLLGLPFSSKKLFGETLPPDIKSSLIQLDLWKDFLNDGHLPSAGNISIWGDREVKETNFIFHTDTFGWHLDRLKFDLMLVNAVKKAGASYLKSEIEKMDIKFGKIWNLKLRDKKLITTKFLVDATGRTSWLSRRQGIKRLVFDNICGYVSFHFSKSKVDVDSMTLIESAPDGWWYSALLPKNIRVTSFFTGKNLPTAQNARSRDGWEKIVKKTNYIKLNIERYNYEFISGPHVMISNSSVLQKVIGKNWLTVGDASVTYDPLSSKGILSAINNGIFAADRIAESFSKKNVVFEDYDKKIKTDFCSYLIKRNYYYRLEKRWRNNTFWKQNQVPVTPDVLSELRT